MKRIKLFIPLLIFLMLAVFFYSALEHDPTELPSALINKPVPAFSLPSLEDKQQQLTEAIFHGEPALLNVWATWCPSCRVEHAYLNDLAKQGINIIGLNYKDDSAAAREWLSKWGNPYRMNIVDQRGRLGLNLGVYGAPETYVVDAEGMIRHKHVGVVDNRVWQKSIRPVWEALLAENRVEHRAEHRENRVEHRAKQAE